MPARTKTSVRWNRSGGVACLVAGLAFLPASGIAQTETVRESGRIAGIVHLVPSDLAPKFNAYPGRAHEHVSHDKEQAPTGGFSDVVVFLEPDPTLPMTPRPPHPRAELSQSGMSFVPRVLPIMAKESVDFPNRDPFYHNVFSYSATKRFDLGRYAEGGSGTVMFPEPGEVRIFCDIHSDMNAVILVLSNRFFTQPDSSGRFELTDVPAGTHRLTVWHPDAPGKAIEVVVPSKSAIALEIRF